MSAEPDQRESAEVARTITHHDQSSHCSSLGGGRRSLLGRRGESLDEAAEDTGLTRLARLLGFLGVGSLLDLVLVLITRVLGGGDSSALSRSFLQTEIPSQLTKISLHGTEV